LTVSDCDTGQAEGFITAACDFEDRVRAEAVSNWMARPLISREGIATPSRDDVQAGGVLPHFGHLPEPDGPKVRKGWKADLGFNDDPYASAVGDTRNLPVDAPREAKPLLDRANEGVVGRV